MTKVASDYFKELFTISSIIDCELILSGIMLSILDSMNEELLVAFYRR